MKKTGIVAAFAAVALTLSACGGDKNGGSSGGKPTKAAAADYLKAEYDDLKQGGTLTTTLTEVTSQQNRFHADSTNDTTNVWAWYNPQLALFDEHGKYQANPDYFTEVTSTEVEGNTVVTYKIREEAVFNDGTPIDVRAFQNTWKANNGTDPAYKASSTDGYSLIRSVEPGASDKEVVVTFNGLYAWWMGLFNEVLHPAVDTAEKFENAYLNQVHPEWGAGPYKVEKVTFGNSSPGAVFVPNEKWWGKPGKLDKRIYKVMEDQASINAFRNGEIDATGVNTGERYETVKDQSGIKIYTSMRPSNFLITLNSASEHLTDPKVREAIMTGFNRKILADIRFKNLDYAEKLPGSLALFQSQDGYEDNFSKAVKFNVNKAKKLLDEAGWKAEGGGIRSKDGKKLELNYILLGDDQTAKQAAVSIQADMKDIGIDLKIREKSSQDFSATINSRDFDMILSGFASTDPYGVAYFRQMYASNSELSKSGTGSPEFDAKIAELEKIGDPKQQIAKANELEVEAFKFYGLMPVFNGPNKIAVKEKVANYGAMGFVKLPLQNIGFVK